VDQIAPAALASTFLNSIVGAGTYRILAATATDDIAPHWSLGLPCGASGIIGRLPRRPLQSYLLERTPPAPSRNTSHRTRSALPDPRPELGPASTRLATCPSRILVLSLIL
jgi:hypothetical protein